MRRNIFDNNDPLPGSKKQQDKKTLKDRALGALAGMAIALVVILLVAFCSAS